MTSEAAGLNLLDGPNRPAGGSDSNELQLGSLDLDLPVRIKRTTNQQLLDVLAEANRRHIIPKDKEFEDKAVRLSKLYGRAVQDRVVIDGTNRRKKPKGKARPTKRDLERALTELRSVALRYDPAKSPGLKGFVRKALNIADLRDLLFRTFRLKLDLPELAALFDFLDDEKRGLVNYVRFLVFFTKLAFEERSLEQAHTMENHRASQQRHAHNEQSLQQRFAARTELAIPDLFTAQDLHTALEKAAHAMASFTHDRQKMINTFEDQGFLSPTAFAEQLKLNFKLRLERTEIAALVAVFVGSNGWIDMVTFLRAFFGGAPTTIASRTQEMGSSLPSLTAAPSTTSARILNSGAEMPDEAASIDSSVQSISDRSRRFSLHQSLPPGANSVVRPRRKRPRQVDGSRPVPEEERSPGQRIKVRQRKVPSKGSVRSVGVSGSAVVHPPTSLADLHEAPEQQVKRWHLIYELKWVMLHEFVGTLRNYKMSLPQLRSHLNASALTTARGEGVWIQREPFTAFCDEFFAHNWFSHRSADRLFSSLDPHRTDQLWLTELLMLVHVLDTRRTRVRPDKMMEECHKHCGIDLFLSYHPNDGQGSQASDYTSDESGSLEGYPDLKVPLALLARLFSTFSLGVADTVKWNKLFEHAAEDEANRNKTSTLVGMGILPEIGLPNHRAHKPPSKGGQFRKRTNLELDMAGWRMFLVGHPELVEFFQEQQRNCRSLLSTPHRPKKNADRR